ncbi:MULTISPECIES: endolytic transglycosylase MltG [Enterococcus]|uniref:Endolytic murein transglycosylase n=1 Tax=Enterococcus entomosocium TaxID=3034352 RepID=A0ABV3MBW3_9ENTE|nr:endolytic transglycosylase MltG [Enterococcus casseliflavus]MDB1710065.1 endolytic transglycosylase MltG [Enterococcus casseliflavus]MDB1717125.1 endolytic transglycosylase MltG [Enterococcus casseliflavus]UOO46784.1 endolytic transglycosylase MltG [Enterococcus casseliflavus]
MSKQQHPEKSFKDEVLKSLESNQNKERDIGSELNSQQEERRSIISRSDKESTEKEKGSRSQSKAFGHNNKIEPSNDDLTGKNQRRLQRSKEDKIVNKIVLIVVLVFLVIGGILGFSAYRYVTSSLQPLDPDDTEKVTIVIPSGSSNKAIGEILEDENIIKSGMIFNYYTKFNNLTGFQAGTYHFSPNMTLEAISEQLQKGEGSVTSDAKVTIPEGFDVDQIGDALAEATNISKDDFLALMESDEFFEKMKETYPELLASAGDAQGVRYRLEGYLFPATYDYYTGNTLEEVVTQMVDKSNSVLSKYFDQIAQKEMTVQEVLTLASLVEKEGSKLEDRKNIAQVFFNRLAIDMPLQSDISILYALGEHKELVTYEDTQVDSPYNLYVHTGYGPGPFNNPSEAAIQAVLDPTPNNYYYFVADIQTQEVYFAETYEQHMQLVEQYVNNTSN